MAHMGFMRPGAVLALFYTAPPSCPELRAGGYKVYDKWCPAIGLNCVIAFSELCFPPRTRVDCSICDDNQWLNGNIWVGTESLVQKLEVQARVQAKVPCHSYPSSAYLRTNTSLTGFKRNPIAP